MIEYGPFQTTERENTVQIWQHNLKQKIKICIFSLCMLYLGFKCLNKIN